MEGGFLGPVTFPLVEHPLPHDARAGPFEGRFHDAVVLAGFTAVAESQGLAEGPLLERPLVDRNPLVAEWVGRTSVRACDEAVEGHSQAEEHFAHSVDLEQTGGAHAAADAHRRDDVPDAAALALDQR